MASAKPKESKSGIPAAEFITDVKQHLLDKKISCENCVRELHTVHNKYKFLESRLLQQKKSLLVKIPDIKATAECVDFLIKKKESDEQGFEAHYRLSDNLYAKANVDSKQDRVFLWLGANVMLEYNYDEAKKLLTKNLASAEKQCKALTEDLNFLKDQITISEVNIARMHNHGVNLRKAAGKK
uniref:Prefoldin subunit 3 n=1 Tax=Lotharella oceanica TaxID=641309 RepID=A0A7S2TK63_9EUKA|mmetsp:Transcript_1792/g.3395  ORF Transcript_1792/g.3395 Transcript_1792/m.3395 type:complete len:183 (+) Transcript_1792:30-578(+)|eukprot:CAMPEP_0170167706 /NCGR_PEP_ID=MMETSP0040_2-20121228/1037_1 /TAXON_ID=641309 /ORGANISM="Lotharella oceanica, Strain CCMP622" /LENGTH=182 /DNA_ID=CAMNT_0010405815 /DNA_START=30 /DNA_END=578 /DNA_ORIENTATION=-